MKRILIAQLIALACLFHATLGYAQLAGGLMFPGPGLTVGSAYTGPGDIFSTSPYAAYSCAEAYTAAYASALSAACDVVDTATGVITCTYHFQANGFVNPTECNTTGKSCFTACSVTKAYDQTGNGRDIIQATLANMPALTFNSTPTGTLPAINCGTGASISLATSAGATQAQPLTMAAVMNRTTGTSAGGAFGSSAATQSFIGSGSGATLAQVNSGTSLTAAATDNTWFFLAGLHNGNGTSSAINVNGSDATGAAGLGSFAGGNIRLCRANAIQQTGLIAEAIVWAASSTATNRNNLNTNAHSSGRYNF